MTEAFKEQPPSDTEIQNRVSEELRLLQQPPLDVPAPEIAPEDENKSLDMAIGMLELAQAQLES